MGHKAWWSIRQASFHKLIVQWGRHKNNFSTMFLNAGGYGMQMGGTEPYLGTRVRFLGGDDTWDGDCSHEIKRCLLLGRKVMTNLDSIFKSKDITLPTKVHLVKAMVFPVVMYGCESWTVKKTERWRIDAFELWCWEDFGESLGLQGDQISPS